MAATTPTPARSNLVYRLDERGVAYQPRGRRLGPVEIVEELWERTRWRNPSCDFTRLSDGQTAVWVTMFVDLDWQTALLLDVRWGPDAGQQDHLAAWVKSTKVTATQFRGQPHDLFDRSHSELDTWRWFVEWTARAERS